MWERIMKVSGTQKLCMQTRTGVHKCEIKFKDGRTLEIVFKAYYKFTVGEYKFD